MINNELITKLEEYQNRSSFAFFSERGLPKLLSINLNSTELEFLDSPIEFIFIDHRYYHAVSCNLFDFMSSKVDSLREIEDERRVIILGELYDLFMDIGFEIVEEFVNFFKYTNLDYEIDSERRISLLVQKTREEN